MVNTQAVCVSVAVLFGVTLSACTPTPTKVEVIRDGSAVSADTVMYKEYVNKENKVIIHYPADWITEDNSVPGQFVLQFLSPEAYEFEGRQYPVAALMLVVSPTTDSREAITARFMASPTSLTEIPLQGKRGTTTLGGQPAIEEKTDGIGDGAHQKGGSILAVHEGFAYVLTYSSLEQESNTYEPIFQEVLKSVKFE